MKVQRSLNFLMSGLRREMSLVGEVLLLKKAQKRARERKDTERDKSDLKRD